MVTNGPVYELMTTEELRSEIQRVFNEHAEKGTFYKLNLVVRTLGVTHYWEGLKDKVVWSENDIQIHLHYTPNMLFVFWQGKQVASTDPNDHFIIPGEWLDYVLDVPLTQATIMHPSVERKQLLSRLDFNHAKQI